MDNIGNIVAGILMAGAPLLIFEAISKQRRIWKSIYSVKISSYGYRAC